MTKNYIYPRVLAFLALVLALSIYSSPAQAQQSSFQAFFNRFAADSAFQTQHIAFPLTYRITDIEDNEEVLTFNATTWYFIDFTEDKEAANREIDAYEGLFKATGKDKMLYIRKGIDNGINIYYYFEMHLNKWYLVKVFDFST